MCVFIVRGSIPTSQLLSTESGQMMRVALAFRSSALSGIEESIPPHIKDTQTISQNVYMLKSQRKQHVKIQYQDSLSEEGAFLEVFLFLNPVSDAKPRSAAAKSRSSCNTGASAQRPFS